MSSCELHLIGPEHKIKTIKNDFKIQGITYKAAKKEGFTHVFINVNGRPGDSIESYIDTINDWTKCDGCEMCEKSKSTIRYALYPPLIMLPTGSKINEHEAIELLKRFKNCTHVAINAAICEGDPIRKPRVIPVIGDFGEYHSELHPTEEYIKSAFFATCIQNGLFQTWAPLYTMFSRGNVTEKKRVLDMFSSQSPVKSHTIVDLYAGIGYFTFAYAKQKPKCVYCWEINWWSVEGLVRAAHVNGFNVKVIHHNEVYTQSSDDEIVVFLEDNQNAIQRIDQLDLSLLSHINMGLLPDARNAFNVAKTLAGKSTVATVAHVHENVRTSDIKNWTAEVSRELGECLFVETIKEYSPGVQHLCGDFLSKKDNC